MTHWCESCGQQLPEGEVPTNATWLGEPAADGAHQHTFANPSAPKKPGRETKLMLGIMGALAAWGLFVGVGSLVSPNDAPDQAAAEAIDVDDALDQQPADEVLDERTTAEVDEKILRGLEDVYEAVDAAPNAPIDDGRAEPADPDSVQIERLQRQLTLRGSAEMVAYRSAEGVVVIDLLAGTSKIIEPVADASLTGDEQYLLRSGVSTFAISLDPLRVIEVVDDAGIALLDASDGNLYFVGAGSLGSNAAVVESVVEGDLTAYLSPTGYSLRPLDGLGVIAVPKRQRGDTLIAGPTEFADLSPHRVLTGNANGMIEQICSAEGLCELAVTNFEGATSWSVPEDFAAPLDTYVLSPDGAQVLRYTADGFAEFYVDETADRAWVAGAGVQSPVWGPRSNFIAWIDQLGEPKLKIMFADERDWLSVDLQDLGAPAALSPELIVLN